MEEWRPIEGTNGLILVSNEGRVGSMLRGTFRELKTQVDKKGYRRLRITLDRKKMSLKVHREVAKAFIDNPHNLPQVNHIDGDKSNNAVSNLEWVSNSDNCKHAIRTGLWETVIAGAKKENDSRKIPIIAFKEDDRSVVLNFESVSEAERVFNSRHICDVLKGKRSKCKGFAFRYAEGR
jgi:uncharacterized protein (UPF0147 family)